MARSPWLRVRCARLAPLKARLRSGSGTPIPSPRRAPRLAGLFYKRHAARARAPATSCRSMVSGSVSLPSPGFFSPFPHGTLPYRWPHVFSLGSWSTRIRAGFLVPRPTQEPRHGRPRTSPTGLSPSPAALSGALGCPRRLLPPAGLPRAALQPRNESGLGSSLFARRYWGNLC